MVYTTENFYFAATLLALGVKLVRVDDVNVKKKAFVLAINEAEALELKDAFYDKALKVDAKTFIDAIKELKDRMYGK